MAHDEVIECGRWPARPGQPEAPKGNTQFKAEATFVKPEVIVAELKYRLAKTGIQGKLLMSEAKRGIMDPDDLDWEAREALMYIKGWRRKELGFGPWKRQRKYREMTTKT